MVDILAPEMLIKSSIHNYRLKFINNLSSILKKEISEDDVIIVDRKILNLYPNIKKTIKLNKIIEIKSNEDSKSFIGLISTIKKILKKDFKKKNKLIAIGGGVIQDITSFTASILFRGVNWIFFPTTLLSQGDSCIGSKTSINFDSFKNQLGNFYPPLKIFIYLKFLDTLNKNEIYSGLGEMSHYFIIDGFKSFVLLKNFFLIKKNINQYLKSLIIKSLKIKKNILR